MSIYLRARYHIIPGAQLSPSSGSLPSLNTYILITLKYFYIKQKYYYISLDFNLVMYLLRPCGLLLWCWDLVQGHIRSGKILAKPQP